MKMHETLTKKRQEEIDVQADLTVTTDEDASQEKIKSPDPRSVRMVDPADVGGKSSVVDISSPTGLLNQKQMQKAKSML